VAATRRQLVQSDKNACALQQLCRQQPDAAEMLAAASPFDASPSIFPFPVDTGQTASHPLSHLSVFFQPLQDVLDSDTVQQLLWILQQQQQQQQRCE